MSDLISAEESSLNEKTRELFVRGEIDEDMQSLVTRSLRYLCGQSHKPITIFFTSIGGHVGQGMAIYDMIRACPAYITMVAVGGLYSMAPVVFQAADLRAMLPHSYMMMHDAQLSLSGAIPLGATDHWIQRESEIEIETYNILLKVIRVKKPRFPMSKLQKMSREQEYLSATVAVDLGLADEIWENM